MLSTGVTVKRRIGMGAGWKSGFEGGFVFIFKTGKARAGLIATRMGAIKLKGLKI